MSTDKVFNFIRYSGIDSIESWRQKRNEILDFFSRNVYGINIFKKLKVVGYTVTTIAFEREQIIRDKVEISICSEQSNKNVIINLYIYRDALAENEKRPIILMVQHLKNFNYDILPSEDIDNTDSTVAVSTYIKSGINVAILDLNSIAYDDPKEGQSGVFSLVSPIESEDAKTIGAWAWGASRAIDYLMSVSYVDTSKIAIAGHSRGGKTSLWAAANDGRIAAVISNNSGCTGSQMAYQTTGEKIRDINSKFPHWFCDNYKRFNDMQNGLPFDQHMLLSTIAPRYLYIASSSEDSWADPKNELWAARLAGDAYALYGLSPLVAPEENDIELDKGYHDGHIVYHRKKGKHSISYRDWVLFLEFFRKKGWVK